jgi:hypothetical protein
MEIETIVDTLNSEQQRTAFDLLWQRLAADSRTLTSPTWHGGVLAHRTANPSDQPNMSVVEAWFAVKRIIDERRSSQPGAFGYCRMNAIIRYWFISIFLLGFAGSRGVCQDEHSQKPSKPRSPYGGITADGDSVNRQEDKHKIERDEYEAKIRRIQELAINSSRLTLKSNIASVDSEDSLIAFLMSRPYRIDFEDIRKTLVRCNEVSLLPFPDARTYTSNAMTCIFSEDHHVQLFARWKPSGLLILITLEKPTGSTVNQRTFNSLVVGGLEYTEHYAVKEIELCLGSQTISWRELKLIEFEKLREEGK